MKLVCSAAGCKRAFDNVKVFRSHTSQCKLMKTKIDAPEPSMSKSSDAEEEAPEDLRLRRPKKRRLANGNLQEPPLSSSRPHPDPDGLQVSTDSPWMAASVACLLTTQYILD